MTENKETKEKEIVDLSWMWHCSTNPKNVLDYGELIDDNRISDALNNAAGVGFRTALRKLEKIGLIKMSDIDRSFNELDKEKWDNSNLDE